MRAGGMTGPGMNAGGRGKQPSLAWLGRPRVLAAVAVPGCRVYMQSGWHSVSAS
jgi:hypothetical protein